MNSIWDRFFLIQRKMLGRAMRAGDAGVFSDVAEAFAEEFAVSFVRWNVAGADGIEKTVFTWPDDHDANASTGTAMQSVTINDTHREHRFTLGELDNSSILPTELAHALCSTLISAIEFHDEFDMHLADARGGGDELGHATVDADGEVIYANERFVALVRRNDPDWDARRLPMSLDQSPTALRHGMTWKGLFFYVEPNSVHIRLRVRPDRRLPDLSPRELEVARLIASGMTFKEVSRQLEMAPSTASTHLYKVYDKLGINRRSALVEWLTENTDALNSARGRAR